MPFDASLRAYRPSAQPPASRVDPVRDVLHDTPVTDPYRWLEGDNRDPDAPGAMTPEVAAWTEAQNAYTRAVLDGVPTRAGLEAKLRPLLEGGSVSAPLVRGRRHFYMKREGRQNQPVVYRREGFAGRPAVLIDPARLDPSGLTVVAWISPSHDGRLLAYGTYRAGDENATLHLLDVETETRLPLEIPGRTAAPDWLPDGSGFVYQHLRDPGDPYTGRVCFHRLGDDPAEDAVLFRQYTREEDAQLATTFGPFGSLSRDGRWLLLGYWVDTRSTDIWLVDFDRWRRTGALDRQVVSVGTAGTASGTVIDDTLYLLTTKGAPRGRLVAVDAADPAEPGWRDLVAERDDAVIEDVAFARGRLAVNCLRQASSVVEVVDVDGRPCGTLRLPGLGTAAVAAEPDRTDAYLTFTSFNHPTSVFRVDLNRPDQAPELWERPDVPVDPETLQVEQVHYRSKDGTAISMFLVRRRDSEPTGDLPTVLYGYGGFNISMTPAFSAGLFQWVEDGGLYAVPNLRGGGEYGDAWHEAGMGALKQNVFDDFVAAAEWLCASGYTNAGRLAVSGGSNGGLLAGAFVTQRPDLCRAAVVAVPLLDMLRYQHFLMARYWVPEYGSAEDAEQFRTLAAYSPYHHVRPGTRYPGVLLTAGEHDMRVHALHARKMAAALQAATTADRSERPVLLWVDREAGHGQGKPLSLRLRDAVDQRAFLEWQLGMP